MSQMTPEQWITQYQHAKQTARAEIAKLKTLPETEQTQPWWRDAVAMWDDQIKSCNAAIRGHRARIKQQTT